MLCSLFPQGYCDQVGIVIFDKHVATCTLGDITGVLRGDLVPNFFKSKHGKLYADFIYGGPCFMRNGEITYIPMFSIKNIQVLSLNTDESTCGFLSMVFQQDFTAQSGAQQFLFRRVSSIWNVYPADKKAKKLRKLICSIASSFKKGKLRKTAEKLNELFISFIKVG